MDSFTENLLSRARQRQKLLEGCSDKENTPVNNKKVAMSEPNLNVKSSTNFVQHFPNSSEGNIPKFSRQNSRTRVSSEISSSPKSQKTLNIQNDNFNMEIKVSPADNVRVEVQIEEHDGDDIKSYSEKQETRSRPQNIKKKRGLGKLAELAKTINEFEDDLTCVRKEKENKSVPIKRSGKSPAPQPPELKMSGPLKSTAKPKAPKPPTIIAASPKEESPISASVKWDKKVLDSLESQGFTRTESNSRLVYKYDPSQEVKIANTSRMPKHVEKENLISEDNDEEHQAKPKSPQKSHFRVGAVADKAALFEASPSKTKDPALLSVSERKALFEKNKGTALVPKAPFGMATPIKSSSPKVLKNVVPQPVVKKDEAISPQKGGIASKVAALFEEKSTISQTQIESGVREQRQQEMDMLINRFNKAKQVISEEPEDHEDVTEETAMIKEPSTKVVTSTSSEEKRRSGGKRCSKADSPKVAAVLSEVKRIKVSPRKSGRLYPSLTDIESVTETENEAGDTRSPTPDNSSVDGSIAESDDVNTSFGRDILLAVCKDQTPQKRPSFDQSTASDLSDVLDDMDDYIDEALAYNGVSRGGPSPPKQGRHSPIEPSHSFNYKNFQSEFKSPIKKPAPPTFDDSPTYVVDGDSVLPLTHTVSFYRKQQTSNTPLRQISRQPLIEEASEVTRCEQPKLIKAKMLNLKNEVGKQEMIISQTSQALNLCNSTPEFMGSTEQVEAERVLLLATHRRQAALHELQRLEVESTLRPQRQDSGHLPLDNGTLSVSKIVLPLKQKYVTALAAAGGKGHHVVCLFKYAERVVPTQLVSTVATSSKNPELELHIPGTIKFDDVCGDFFLTFEVYCLQAQEEVLSHEVKYHIKKANVKSTPKKSKQDSRLIRPIKESPAGPQAVRSPTFALMGYVVFSAQAVNKKQWSLNNAPSMSPLEGTVEMHLSCELSLTIEHRGFLTMFEDVSGFGAWHRRWCLIKGHMLNYWKYPDDEKKAAPINSIDLNYSVTSCVGPVSRDVCARLHTFLIETERDPHPQDKDSLVTVRKGAKTIIRHLLSADTKEERIEWCNKFNAALAAIMVCGKRLE